MPCNTEKRRLQTIGTTGKAKLNFNCLLSECAVVDNSEQDEEISSDSPTDATDSDEDFTPNKKTTPKWKSKHVAKSQTPQNEEVSINKL